MNQFETSGLENDPLGLWTPTVSTADAAPGALSFSLGGSESDSAETTSPVFRINLPADGASAAQALNAREGYLTSLNAALEAVPSRLDGLVARTQQRRKATGGVSFGVDIQDEPGPEGELLALLTTSPHFPRSSAGNGSTEGGEVSFGLQESASAAWQQARAGFETLTRQIEREMLHFAWVETHLAESLIARTTVRWTGTSQTAFAVGLESSQVALHQRSLHIVTQTRGLHLRLFATIAVGATKVSSLLATPGGAVLALPAVYQYVMQIVAQVKQLQQQA